MRSHISFQSDLILNTEIEHIVDDLNVTTVINLKTMSLKLTAHSFFWLSSTPKHINI